MGLIDAGRPCLATINALNGSSVTRSDLGASAASSEKCRDSPDEARTLTVSKRLDHHPATVLGLHEQSIIAAPVVLARLPLAEKRTFHP